MGVYDQHASAGHAVLFAESETELADVAGGLLTDRLAAGDVVIVMATADHRRQLDGWVRAAGLDPDRARQEGRLIALDAAETLARLTPEGSFDPRAFDEVVGTLVRSAAARGRVQAFGEMVALLWEQGRVPEAIELEAAWTNLVEATGASLICGYPRMSGDAESAPDVRAVCAQHSAAVGDAPFARVWHFGPDLAAVPEARRLAVTALRARGLAGTLLEDTETTIAELVANAVLHGQTAFSLTVRLDHGRVRVEVADESPRVPVVRPAGEDATSGRGLHLLHALTDRWGIDDDAARGKVVWTELAR